MAREVVMPQLGLSMDSGRIIQWLEQSGDWVEAGSPLLEVESDKATVEVEAVDSGILHIVQGPSDGEILVGEVIAYVLAEGEVPPTQDQPVTSLVAARVPEVAPADSLATSTEIPEVRSEKWPARLPSSPASRRRAKELGVDWHIATGTGPEGRIKERDVERLAASLQAQVPFNEAEAGADAEQVQISPVARRLAATFGLDINRLADWYAGKRLERADVEQAIREAVRAAQMGATLSLKMADGGAETPARRQPAGHLRRLIAERMARSAHTNASVTLTTEADATELVRIREQIKADSQLGVEPSYNALLAKLVAKALLEHPALNASLDGSEIVYWETVNIGIAVDTERGLIVPVFRDVQAKSVHELVLEMNDLLIRTVEGKALPDELAGSTFTITNLGIHDIDFFTPIINPPECAVLGIGRLYDKWVVADGKPVIRTTIALSLTFDHRLVDGAPAARFLKRVKQLIEQPYLWLV